MTDIHNKTESLNEINDGDDYMEELFDDSLIDKNKKYTIVWEAVIFFIYIYLGALYGIFLAFTSAKTSTLLFGLFVNICATVSVNAGSHRLWSHRSYKAKWPLRLFMTFWNTVAFQYAVIDWARNHRTHHKFCDTDADPHNSKRGFFFSHIGWLLVRKHPLVKSRGKEVDMSDLYEDPILRFEKKYYKYLMPLCCFILPAVIPWYFWNESLSNSWFICVILRYCFGINISGFVNSAAHMWGYKKFDKHISPTDNYYVSYISLGESFHNFHHAFPWDHRAPEIGKYVINLTTMFITVCAKLGLAYDLKTATDETIIKRIQRTGDIDHNERNVIFSDYTLEY